MIEKNVCSIDCNEEKYVKNYEDVKNLPKQFNHFMFQTEGLTTSAYQACTKPKNITTFHM